MGAVTGAQVPAHGAPSGPGLPHSGRSILLQRGARKAAAKLQDSAVKPSVNILVKLSVFCKNSLSLP